MQAGEKTITVVDKYLAQVKARVEKATPGPWEPVYSDEECYSAAVYAGGAANGSASIGTIHSGDEDAAFIAHARTDIERLVAMVEAARKNLLKAKAAWCLQNCACYLCSALAELDRLAAGGRE